MLCVWIAVWYPVCVGAAVWYPVCPVGAAVWYPVCPVGAAVWYPVCPDGYNIGNIIDYQELVTTCPDINYHTGHTDAQDDPHRTHGVPHSGPRPLCAPDCPLWVFQFVVFFENNVLPAWELNLRVFDVFFVFFLFLCF